MKTFIYILALAAIATGCSDNVGSAGTESSTSVQEQSSKEGTDNIQARVNDVDVDTIGMAEFLAMKAATKQGKTKGLASDGTIVNGVNVDTIGFADFKRMKAETARKAYADSIRRADVIAAHKKYDKADNAGVNESVPVKKHVDETPTANQSTTATEPAPEKEKKGWSNKAKGAAIGAATGAAAGAIINKKNRGVGGVVGGVVGAAAGYGIGRHKDKKDTLRNKVSSDTTDQQR